MNYFKSAEQILASVPALEQARKNLSHRLGRLSESGKPSEVTAQSLEKYQTVREANDALSEFLDVVICKHNIAENEKALSEIYAVLGQLPSEQKAVLEMWYIEKLPKEEIKQRLYIESLGSIYALRNRALAAFALRYYGAAALGSV